MKKAIISALIISLCFTLFGCTPVSTRYTETVTDAFDTVSTVVAYCKSREEFDRGFKLFESELTRYDRLFDIYSEYDGINNLCTLNSEAAKAPVKVDGDIIALLNEGKTAYAESEGVVNICMGSVLSLWHNAREAANKNPDSASLPERSALKEAAKHTSPDSLIIDGEKGTVYFEDEELKLDAGAIAKGWCAERLAETLKAEAGWKDFMLNLGGNVVTSGHKGSDGSTRWNIQIENPNIQSSSALETLSLTDRAVVTSGDYQRYFTFESKNYCHIIDPKTLMPADYFSGVTVICQSSALADRLSTQLFIMPLDEGKKLVESLDGVEAVWVDKDYNSTFSSGFGQYKKL